MSTSKPTPAPWNVDLETGEIIAGENGNYAVLGTIYSADDFPCNENDIAEECKANARLIAAAPELLEALERVESVFGELRADDLPNTPNVVMVEMIQSLDNARKVIAKAKASRKHRAFKA